METYYNPEDLAKFGTIGEEAPQLAEKFFDYYGAVFAEGALTAREKSLIALAVAHTVQCPYCIDSYTNDCLNRGVSEEEMTEAVHVAAAIRGGATMKSASKSGDSDRAAPSKLLPANLPPGARDSRRAFTSFIFCITSKSRGLPGIPSSFMEGETARHMVLAVLSGSATTRLVVMGSTPRAAHSADA